MKFWLLLVFVALVAVCCNAQIKAGTIVVVNAEKKTVVIAADSRIRDQYSSSDNRCKVGALGGKLIFGMSGHVLSQQVGGPKYWDASDIADHTFAALESEQFAGDLPKEAAQRWAVAVAMRLKHDLETYGDESLVAPAEDGKLSTEIFAGLNEDKELVIAQAAVSYSRSSSGRVTTNVDVSEDKPPVLIYLGATSVIDELEAQQTERAKDWKMQLDKELQMLKSDERAQYYPIALVNLTIRNDEGKVIGDRHVVTVGGPVNAISIDPDEGISWVQRSKDCER